MKCTSFDWNLGSKHIVDIACSNSFSSEIPSPRRPAQDLGSRLGGCFEWIASSVLVVVRPSALLPDYNRVQKAHLCEVMGPLKTTSLVTVDHVIKLVELLDTSIRNSLSLSFGNLVAGCLLGSADFHTLRIEILFSVPRSRTRLVVVIICVVEFSNCHLHSLADSPSGCPRPWPCIGSGRSK